MDLAIEIRPAHEGDLAAVANLYRYLHPDDPPLEEARARTIWKQIINSSGTTVLLGLVNGLPAGSCILVVVPNLTRDGRSFGLIENVVTEPRFRRRGVGTAMLKHALALASEANCYKLVLTTRRTSGDVFAFYEKAGFERATRTAFEVRLN